MSPVDSIRPPMRVRKTAKKSGASVPVRIVPVREKPVVPDAVPQKSGDGPDHVTAPQKQKTVIAAVVVIVALIFIGWVALFMGGKLTRSKASDFGSVLSGQLQNLWQDVKTDILKIKNINQNTNTANANDEQIKKLENSVFPQFNDPTKQ